MRRLLVVLALACSSAHPAWARVAPVGPTRKSDTLADRVTKFAEHQIGVPYRFGGSSRRSGFDCSGLVYAAYRSIGKA
ncbi:MAG TPA: NlpC/P60 family protein, partial [Gaiellaceae bacterium]